jgi:hypothetical protein
MNYWTTKSLAGDMPTAFLVESAAKSKIQPLLNAPMRENFTQDA